MSTLNWRRDPGYAQSIVQHELRMQQLENEIERSKERTKQIESETEQIESETEQIEKDIEQLEKDILQLDRDNARLENLLSCVDQLCFPPESSSIPPLPTESDCGSSSR